MINFVLQSPYSLFVAYLILIGTYRLGGYFLSIKSINLIFKKISVINFQKLVIGHIISLLILFPLIAFTNHSSLILKFFASLLVLLSIFEIYDFIKKYHKINLIFLLKDKYLLFNVVILVLYLFLTSSPETSADTLDYHIGTALNILRFGSYVFLPEWFTSIQSGVGETLIALGYALGAEQYGSLIQFSSLVSITGIIFKICESKKFFNSKYFANLIIISCPVLLFLTSGSKPQLFFSTLLFMALSIVFTLEKKNYLYHSYLIICILIFLSIAGKFSYNLSGFIIWIFATLKIVSFKNFLRLFLITFFSFLIILCPFIYLKWISLGGNFISYFFSPFPLHLPGYDTFLEHVRSPTYVKFPFFLFFNTSLSRISETLAFSSIFLIFLIYKLNYKKTRNNNLLVLILIIFIYFLISNFYASPNARYYFDVILWSALGIKFYNKLVNYNILKYILLIQPLLITLALFLSVINFFPASLNHDFYVKMKNKFAFQYSGISWANQNLPNDSSVIINARPISTYKDFAISGTFMNFTNEIDSIYYRKIIKTRKPKYLISFGKEPNFGHLEGCVISLYKKKENVGFHATRNIFGRGNFYNAYIHMFDYKKLPNC